ncbi:MAG: murein hydrolase activator EnvC [Candidatus Berkiella sp.]
MITRYNFIFLLCLWTALNAHAYTPTKQTEKSKQKLELLQSKISSTESSIHEDKKQLSLLNKQLRSLEIEIGKLNEHIRGLQTQIDNSATQVTQLTNHYAVLEKDKAQHEKLLSELILQTYKNYQNERWQLLLSNKDIQSLMRLTHYYHDLSGARKKEIHNLITNLSSIEATAKKIEQEKSNLEQLQKAENQQKNDLLQSQNQRKEILGKLNNQVNANEKNLVQLKGEQHALEAVMKKLKAGLAKMPEYVEPSFKFQKNKSTLFFPIQGQSATFMAVTAHPGEKNKKSYVKATTGTPVYAIYSGRVVFSEWLRGVGLLLIIDHGNGYMSLYGNNDILYKSVGDTVDKAEMIARVGQSGGHSEPGLYFELRKDGMALDLSNWFKVG